jgi:chromosome partitioning protein
MFHVEHEGAVTRVIAVVNQKGGVGKTTTAVNLSAGLALAERRTVLVDLDPQGNATTGLGLNKAEPRQTIYNVLLDGLPLSQATAQTELAFLSIVPSEMDLVGAEIELVSTPDREHRLKAAVDAARDQLDFIVIDCPPSLGLLTLNALTAADSVLIPLQCEYYAMEGLAQLIRTINMVRERLNPRLAVEGILFTMFDGRTSLGGPGQERGASAPGRPDLLDGDSSQHSPHRGAEPRTPGVPLRPQVVRLDCVPRAHQGGAGPWLVDTGLVGVWARCCHPAWGRPSQRRDPARRRSRSTRSAPIHSSPEKTLISML